MKLETERLILRPLKLSDAESSIKNLNNLNVSKWLLKIAYPYTKEHAEGWIKYTMKNWKKKNSDNYDFGVELKEEKSVIGGIGLGEVNGYSATVGYWLGENYHRKGYGSEMLGAVLDFAFKKLNLKRIEATVFPGNPSSGKLLEKFGFKKEGVKRKAGICTADGIAKDEIMYGLLKEDFKQI